MTVILLAASLVLASVTIVAPLAGALEAPGAVRLSRESYVVVRGLYYPGFTIAGVAEPLAIFALCVLLASVARTTWPFALVAAALAAEALAHLLYWVLIAPMNEVWLVGDGPPASRSPAEETDREYRTALRDRWELSHVYRLLASTLAFVLLVAASLVVTGGL